MASLNTSQRQAVVTANRNTLTTADNFTFVPNTSQVLELHNNTAGSINVTIKGTAPSAAFVIPGAGGQTYDLSGGLVVAVGASQSKILHLDAMAAYLAGSGVVNVTSSAAGITAVLLTN